MSLQNGRRKPVFRNQAVSVIIVRCKHNGKKLYYTGSESASQKLVWSPEIDDAFHFTDADAADACMENESLLRRITKTDRVVVAEVTLVNLSTHTKAPPKYRKRKRAVV